WGDLARGMYPTYTGHRPRVQLFHGDADPTIKYPNFTESIKQWTDVLGLATAPTTTDTVTLGSHQATRQQWKNACGYVVLDAFNSKGGDHGPSDAIFNASFVVPFLGLDKPDAVDPELAACGVATGGSGTGGAAAGGASGAGSGGGTALGGAPSSGTAGSGGNGSAGTPAVGAGAAGMLGVGGSSGAAPSGTGGALASGAAAGAITSGGSGAVAGESQSSSANAPDNGGCSCGVARRASPVAGWAALLLSALLFRRRREWAERSR
ncbi:MAG: MYXO-CTERM sorting domain-containing protein, partial [Polyangiaceae bacterium]